MPVPNCNLRTHRPTPTTASYTVSTRAPLDTVPARLFHYSTLAARILVASLIVFVVWMKFLAVYPNLQWPGGENALRDSALAQAGFDVLAGVPSLYLAPAACAGLWICSWRGYTGKSIVVFSSIGLS